MKQLINIIIAIIVIAMISCNRSEQKDDIVEISPSFIEAVHQFDELYPFSEGMAAVRKDNKFGFINTKGELVIPCQYMCAGDFSEGLACVFKDENNMNISFVDYKGNVYQTKYSSDFYYDARREGHIAHNDISFQNGVCKILYGIEDVSETQTVYINKQMKEVEKPSKENPTPIINNNYEVFSVSNKDIYGGETELYGLKKNTGEVVIPAKYNDICMGDNGVVLASIFVENFNSHQSDYYIPYGLTVYGYVDMNGISTFTEEDFVKLEDYTQEQEEQARIEEEMHQHPEIKFNAMLADNAWHAYGTWGGTPMEYIVTFRPTNKYAGYATYVRWINNGERNEYSERGTSDYYKYIIKGNILEMEWDSYWDGLVKYRFAIEYSNGEILLMDTRFSNGIYRPISKERDLVPQKYKL